MSAWTRLMMTISLLFHTPLIFKTTAADINVRLPRVCFKVGLSINEHCKTGGVLDWYSATISYRLLQAVCR